MNKNNYSLDLHAGIDTLEVTSETYVIGAFAFITHDATRRITQDDTAIPKYRYRFNPDNTTIDASTFTGYQTALQYMLQASMLQNPVKTRIDYRFDLYSGAYTDVFKLNKLLLLLIAEQYNIKNRYQCIDMLTGEKKTLCIKNQYIEAEAYNKAIQEPDSGIMCRLELRSKKLYDDEAEETKELRELDKWFVRLANSTTTFNLDKLIKGLNDNLMERYKEEQARKSFANVAEFVTKYADFIFTTRQLVDLYRRIGYKNPNAAATKYKRSHKIECFSLNDIRKYAITIRASAEKFCTDTETKLSVCG